MSNLNLKYYILAELREKHENLSNNKVVYNDYVSQKSMQDLASNISSLGYNCKYIGGIPKLLELYNSGINCQEIIFINYNYGLPNQFKRGQSPIILEMMNAKYSGSDPFVSLLVNDKFCSKKIMADIGVLTPPSTLILNNDDIDKINHQNINFPVVVKPNSEGSSLGIDEKSLCTDLNHTQEKCKELINKYDSAIVEEYIPGYEITVWIIGNKGKYELIQPLLISIDNKYYFESKIITMYDKANHVRNYSLADTFFSNKIIKDIISTSKIVFETLGMRDYGRIDFRFDGVNLYFIEANALPIFSKTSEIGQIANLCNITYEEICAKLISTINDRLMTKTY